MSSRISLKDVARESGVSISTASQALRNDGRISPKTRDKVAQAAERLGYQRDPLLAGLASRKFHQDSALLGTGIMYVSAHWKSFKNNVKERYATEAEPVARKFGFSFHYTDVTSATHHEKLTQQWFDQGIRGILLANLIDEVEVVKRFDWSRFSVVMCGGAFITPMFRTIKADVNLEVVGGYEELRKLGFERIGIVMLPHAVPLLDDQIRHAAALYVLNKDNNPIPVFQGPQDDPQFLRAWFLAHKPQVILGFPENVPYLLEVSGIRIPQEVSYAAISRDPATDNSRAGNVQEVMQIARVAVEQLDMMIRHGETGVPDKPEVISIQSRWKGGPTLCL